MDLSAQSILVTGGTGSFGQKFAETVLRDHPGVQRLVIFSRDELKQWQMQQRFPESRFPQLRFFIGRLQHAKLDQLFAEILAHIVDAFAFHVHDGH